MKVAGIIAEYNPFHNGHRYHLTRTREITGADFCIVVMSGNYTQRGEPALMDKYLRTKMALEGGADLVLELPVCYSCASASRFADGAVSLLDRLGIVDHLVFGSECGDVALLKEAASILVAEPPAYTKRLREKLRGGCTYPAAQSAALSEQIRSGAPGSGRLYALDTEAVSRLLSSPNNILGIEYCKSLLSRGSSICPVTICRSGSDYLDTSLPQADGADACHASALAIRTALLTDRQRAADLPAQQTGRSGSLCAPASHTGRPDSLYLSMSQTVCPTESLRLCVPEHVYALMQKEYGRTFPVFPDMLSEMLHYKLLMEAECGFSAYLDVSSDLSDRIRNLLPEYRDFTSFCMLLKTKDMTLTRISRCLLHIFLEIRKCDMVYPKLHKIPYARMLGFRASASPLLTAVKAASSIPLLSKLADAGKFLGGNARKLLEKDIQAAHLYNSLILHAYGTRLPEETRRQMIRI